MRKIAIVHYSPLELFPPVINLLDLLGEKTDLEIVVYTTKAHLSVKEYKNPRIKIHVYPRATKEKLPIRLLKYFYFNFFVLFSLFRFKPESILYYETYSAYPVYLYKRFVKPAVKIYVHCHEYFSPQWWRERSMKLMRFYYKKEIQYLYPRAEWISHTNEKRMQFFLSDIGLTGFSKAYIYPNFPPESWLSNPPESSKNSPVPCKLVYVGSFGSLDTLYIREIVNWVHSAKGALTLDIYSFIIPDHVARIIQDLNDENIRIKGSISYDDLPKTLEQYDVGLILYKGTTKNFIYNAPNKLFEYLVCGLDVWYPQEMEGAYEYDSNSHWPKVVRLNFNDLSSYDLNKLIDRDPSKRRDIIFTAEKASQPLIKALSTD